MVTQDSVSLGDTFEHVDNVQKNLDVQKKVASKDGGKFAVILNDLDSATGEEKQAAINAYAAAYAEVYNIDIESALVVAVTKVVNGAHYQTESGASQIVINDESMKNARDYMATLGHEVTHAQTAQGALESRENHEQEESYAHLMGGYSADNYAFVLENSGLDTVRDGDINRHIGNNAVLIQQNSIAFLVDEATLPTGSIDYYLNRQEVQEKLSQLSRCNQQGAGSAACQQVNQTNQLDHIRDAELQAACQDMNSPGCRAEIAKAQAALDSFDEGVSPWDDTRIGQEQESIRVVLNDPSGRERQEQQAQLNALFDGLIEFTPGAGDVKGFVDAESGIDYLVAGLGLIPVAGDLLKKAKEAFSAGRVEEAKALLGKAQEHLQHVDADFDDLPSSNQLALTEKGLSHPPELPHSGKQDGDAVAPHEKPSTPEAESTLAKQETSDVEGDDGRMLGEGVAPNRTATQADVADHFQQNRKFWTQDPIQYNGNKVYQRNDLIDPTKVDPKTGKTNLELMQAGRAPLGPDGKPVNLHHLTQKQDGAIAEVTQTLHKDNHATLHMPNTVPSGIDRTQFNKWRRDYWKNRANDF